MRSTGGGGEAEDQAGGRGQGGRRGQRTRREEGPQGEAGGAAGGGGGGRRGPARGSSSRKRGRTGGGGDGRGEEEEDRRRRRRTAGKRARKVVLKAAQAVEDRPIAVLRRRQEQEEDEVAATHHRRTGIPARVLIDKVGGKWSGWVGGVDRQVAHVANARAARRISVEAAQKRRLRGSSGKPHGASTPDEYIEAKDGTIVLARHLQDEVLARIDHNWRQTEGQEFVRKALRKANAAAARRWQQQHGPVRRRPASPPDQAVGTESPQFKKEMKKYFRNHCDKAYGGQLPLKFLITLEDIPLAVVELMNSVAVWRTNQRRNCNLLAPPALTPDETPGNIFLRRADRASTPVPDDYVAAGTRRHKAYCRVRTLKARRRESPQYVSQQTMDHAMCELHDAERASVDSGFRFKNFSGSWENDFESTQRSQFEMVLRAYLTHHLKFDDEMLGTIVNKRTGSASTPAQGGKGCGQGGGRGGKGGDRGGATGGKGGRGDKGGGKGGRQDSGRKGGGSTGP